MQFVACSFLSLVGLILLHGANTAGNDGVRGPSQPIVALAGDDVILPCHIEPAVSAEQMTVEWTRTDLQPDHVLLLLHRGCLDPNPDPSYRGRSSLFPEQLSRGNVSLKLYGVKPSDGGTYRCFVPSLMNAHRDAVMQLSVGVASEPLVSIVAAGNDGVKLRCESSGWPLRPEVCWRDGEGNVISAGRTEARRGGGASGLWSLSSTLTVEESATNRFTCSVQQQQISRTRETHIHIPGDLFSLLKLCSRNHIIAAVAAFTASAAVILVILAFLCYNRRRGRLRESETMRLLLLPPSSLQVENQQLKAEVERINKLLAELTSRQRDSAEPQQGRGEADVGLLTRVTDSPGAGSSTRSFIKKQTRLRQIRKPFLSLPNIQLVSVPLSNRFDPLLPHSDQPPSPSRQPDPGLTMKTKRN
uniref:butyrophilin subfamily 3 member A2-like n=1 Tax=Centroberyx gerrardi TaxID=166262 RepID=UPI003AAD0A56